MKKRIRKYMLMEVLTTIIVILIALSAIILLRPLRFLTTTNDTYRISIINSSGEVTYNDWMDKSMAIFESSVPIHRPEVEDAFLRGFGYSEKLSPTENVMMCYFAFRINLEEVLRVSITKEQRDNILILIALDGLVVIITVMLLTRLLSHILSRRFVSDLDSLNFDDEKSLKIQELSRIYPELAPLTKRLLSQADQRRQFSSNVSHELKTPLAIISQQIDVLALQDDKNNSTSIKSLDIIRQRADNLMQLVDDILRLSKLDENTHTLQICKGNVKEIIDNLVYDYSKEHNQIALSFEYLGDDTDFVIDCDRLVLQTAISEIVSNAVKYAKSKVTVSVSTMTSCIVISITNDGATISKNDLPYIFDRFYRAETSHSKVSSGYGIGLSLVKRIIDLHSGEISCTSDSENGTNFTLKLPKVQNVKKMLS
ncbi:hypothetical protein FACS1894125_6490 [Actinomycetota bacterium]|nr:hypothetical protein FACS1894125_6490 [Actinomycetota bacterium]